MPQTSKHPISGQRLVAPMNTTAIANCTRPLKNQTSHSFREVQDGGSSWLMGVWGKAKFPPVAPCLINQNIHLTNPTHKSKTANRHPKNSSRGPQYLTHPSDPQSSHLQS